jgi:tRNA pseudouridine55 synthase
MVKTPMHGVLLLDKPAGLSSNLALQKVRNALGRPKAGHTGTLDPLATGLLPICVGEATKFSQYLLDSDKTYEAVVRLGMISSTGDAEGRLEVSGDPNVSEAQIREALKGFVGAIDQIPPMYSALKMAGRPLYEYARAGVEVARQSRNIFINSLELHEFKASLISVSVSCSKGTYIRTLAEDVGRVLGCGAYLAGLRRTRIGPFGLEKAYLLPTLEELGPIAAAGKLLPIDSFLMDLPKLYLAGESARRLTHGLSVPAQDGISGKVRFYGPGGAFMGLGETTLDGQVVPLRLLAESLLTDALNVA